VSTVRTHEPGYRFTLTDRQRVRDDIDLLITRVETHAVQLLPDDTQLDLEPIGLTPATLRERSAFFEVRYQAVPAEVPFRPARRTAKNTISGVQTARVTAEEIGENTELNSDKFGRVRVRFPWDQRENDGTPTSKWVRVAQYWAGPGFGALYVPRVGHEVIVAFERGDPDRPLIVGRVYNEQNPPPYAEPNTTKSTIKSDSVGPDGASADGFNEFRFDDAASKEQVFLHAQRNLDEVVRANHSTTVGGDQSNSVGGDQSNTVMGSRTHEVSGTELVHVVGDRTTLFDSAEFHKVGATRCTLIGANDIRLVSSHDVLGVGGNQVFTVSGEQTFIVGSSRTLNVAAGHSITVGAAEALSVAATRSVSVGAVHTLSAASHIITTAGLFMSTAPNHMFNGDEFSISAGGATLKMSGGFIHLNNGGGCSITMAGGLMFVESGDYLCKTGGTRKLSSGGATIVASGGPTSLNGGGGLFGTAPIIKWN
jgi:type VI secretion system secreted protein VgrG